MNKKRLAEYYRIQTAKAKKQAKREGKIFVGRVTEAHGKKYKQQQTNQQVENDSEVTALSELIKSDNDAAKNSKL